MFNPPGVIVNGSTDNSGINALLNVQAESQRKQMINTYHCYDLENENNEKDLNGDENDKYNIITGRIPNIITNDVLKYFGLSATNWHPYYNYQNSVKDIRKSYLQITNKDIPYGKKERKENDIELFGHPDMCDQQASDLTRLRRVIKQGPIMETKSQILPLIIFVTIFNIILLILYFVTDEDKIPKYVIWIGIGIVNFILVTKLGWTWYAINHQLKNEGIINWVKLKETVADASNNQPDLNTIEKKLDDMDIMTNPNPMVPMSSYPPGYLQPQQPPQQPKTFMQEITSGMGRAIGDMIVSGFKSLVQSKDSK